jgi:hypothetical protein
MVSFLSNRQCTIAALVVLLILFMALQPSLSPAHAQPAPTITLNPTEGPPGTEVTVQGSGWTAGDIVSIQLGGPESGAPFNEVAQATVDQQGNFTTTFTVPADANIGDQVVAAEPPGGGGGGECCLPSDGGGFSTTSGNPNTGSSGAELFPDC